MSLAPRSTPGVADNKDVVYLDLVEPTPMVEFNIVWRRDDASPVLHTFLDIVRQVAQDALKRDAGVSLRGFTCALPYQT